jgi:hypothetical protein
VRIGLVSALSEVHRVCVRVVSALHIACVCLVLVGAQRRVFVRIECVRA